jgi:hypothetical protein
LRDGSCTNTLESSWFTQPDPIGLAGGLSLYGFAGGDPVNNWDPFGLDVQFRGEGAEEAWNALKRQARRGLRDKEKAVREASREMLDVLTDMERDADVTYVVQFTTMSDEELERTGGGREFCRAGSPFCAIEISTRGSLAGTMTSLAHEAGGAWGSRQGIDHYGITGAVKWENAARRILGCDLRSSHAAKPSLCR